MIFVTVGSQKFQFNRLLIKIDEIIDKDIIKDKVYAQIGVSDYKPRNYEYTDFMSQDEFNKKLDECTLLISHAGTGVIVNAVKRGKKVIATPRLAKYGEHVDDHQIQLIKQFDELNFIEPLYELDELEHKLKEIDNKSFKNYESNTDSIIESVSDYIERG